MQEWGSDISKEGGVNSATVKYTDFLLATASGKVEGVKAPGKLATPFERTKVAAYTLAAMTPCMRLYAFLGKEFQELLNANEESHPYQKWIDNYSSESFQVCHIIKSRSFYLDSHGHSDYTLMITISEVHTLHKWPSSLQQLNYCYL